MKYRQVLTLLTAALTVSGLTGCLNLKPTESRPQHFVLASLPPPAAGAIAGARSCVAIGVGPIRMSGYLHRNTMAVRLSPSEIDYLEHALWAERLDTAWQRVLMANLTALLPNDHLFLPAWRPQDVSAELYVSLDQFESDTNGVAVLQARWRILVPGTTTVLRAGDTRLTRQAVAPSVSPSASATALSELLEEFSREMAETLKTSVPPRK